MPDRTTPNAVPWRAFATARPDLAATARRLLDRKPVALLATVTGSGRPRIHPFIPKIVDERLVAFVTEQSPKIADLRALRPYAIHLLPGAEDEEFVCGGIAREDHGDASFRSRVAEAMAFATGVDDDHVLFEFQIERALHTTWLDFGTAKHRPSRRAWRTQT